MERGPRACKKMFFCRCVLLKPRKTCKNCGATVDFEHPPVSRRSAAVYSLTPMRAVFFRFRLQASLRNQATRRHNASSTESVRGPRPGPPFVNANPDTHPAAPDMIAAALFPTVGGLVIPSARQLPSWSCAEALIRNNSGPALNQFPPGSIANRANLFELFPHCAAAKPRAAFFPPGRPHCHRQTRISFCTWKERLYFPAILLCQNLCP